MKLTRRTIIAGAMGIPGLAAARWFYPGHESVPASAFASDMPAGRVFGTALGQLGLGAREVSGVGLADAREMLALRLPVFAGVTDDADTDTFAHAGAEEGYAMALILRGNGTGCSGFTDDPEWNPAIRRLVGAGSEWIGAFAGLVADPEGPPASVKSFGDPAMVSAWLLMRHA